MQIADMKQLTGDTLARQVDQVGGRLIPAIRQLIDAVPRDLAGPVSLAQALKLDKVLSSRVLKALRQADIISGVFYLPGPDPLRQIVAAAARRGVSASLTREATGAIDRFEVLIHEVGDRSLLDSILSAWIPEARREFELRRKQAAFKAMSQLRGVQAESILATCILAPARDPDLLDLIWVHGLFGLHRVRPGAAVKVASRRMSREPGARRPQSIDGLPIDDSIPPLVSAFCSSPVPPVEVRRVDDSVFYTLGGEEFGAASSVDVAFVEVNPAELQRRLPLKPGRSTRESYFFAETVVPAKWLQFDMLVEQSIFPGKDPALRLHDTAFEGVADPMDSRRDLDRLDLLESVQSLGMGLGAVRSTTVPRYAELIRHVFERMGYPPPSFRGYRCAIEYPLYGSQTAMIFDSGT